MRSCAHKVLTVYILRVKNDYVHNVEKVKKNNLKITSKSHVHPHTMRKIHAKFHNNRYKTVRGVALTRGTHCLYIEGEKWLSSQCGKSDKNVLTIISKPHAHSYSMKKTYAKFQNDRYKTVRGVALTRGTHCLYIEGEKWLSSQCGKSDKNVLTIIPNPHAHPHIMKKTHANFQNNQYKTVRGVALKRSTHCLYIEVKKTKFTMWKKQQTII